MLRKVLTLLSGNAAASIILLVRNLIVARLIPVEDFGIAATFAVTMALVEMSTQFGLQQQIVQSRDGDNERFQAALQGFQLLRGVLAGVLLFCLAGPIAAFLKIPEVAWAYQVMALMPVLRSLQHFDIHRLNRSLRYGPMLLTSGVPAIASLIAVFPLAIWLGDYRVMLFALVLQEALGALTSQVLAERRYRLVLDRTIMASSLRFGWPLLLNGVLLFLVMQGDKIIVGRELGMVALGIFGMGVTLTLTPTLILAKSLQNFFLPQLSAAKDTPEAWHATCTVTMQTAMLFAIGFSVAFLLVSAPLVSILLGDAYAALIDVLFFLALIQTFRILKAGPTIAAIALGHTGRLAFANLPRVLMLIPMAWLAVAGAGLTTLALLAVVGEFLGFLVTLALVGKDMKLQRSDLAGPAASTTAILVLCTLSVYVFGPQPAYAAYLVAGASLVVLATQFRPVLTFVRQGLPK